MYDVVVKGFAQSAAAVHAVFTLLDCELRELWKFVAVHSHFC